MVASKETAPRALAITLERWWLPILMIIVAVGGLFRVADLQLIEFRHDSAWWSYAALKLLQGGAFPLIGQPVGSVNVPVFNGPIMTYLVSAIFALFGYEPLYAAAFVVVCNTAGIFITFALGRRMYSTAVGLIAALLMSIAPWLVLYGRMLWPQALFLTLVPLILYVLLATVEENKAWQPLLLGVLLGIGLQLHLSILALIGICGLVLILYSRRKTLIVLMVLGVLIGYSPIIIHDAVNNFTNLSVLLRLPSLHTGNAALAAHESRIEHIAKAIWNFSNILSGQGMWVSKLSKTQYLPPSIDWAQGIIGSSLFALALLAMLWTNIKGKPFKQAIKFPHQDAIILLAALVPLFYLALSSSPVLRHYFIFLYPAVFLIMARGLTQIQSLVESRQSWKPLKWALPIALTVFCVLNLVTIQYARSFLNVTGGKGDYGTVLADKEDAVQAILNQSGQRFEIDLRGVQETLPYVFLTERHLPIEVVGSPEYAERIVHSKGEGMVRHYRVIEPEYDKTQSAMDGNVIYNTRGIVVVEVQE